MMVRRPPQKSRSETSVLVTLQREPPLTRIFAPGFFAPSRTTTVRSGANRRAKIAVVSPAAPAPMTMTSKVSTDTLSFNHQSRRARASALGGDGRGRFLGAGGVRNPRALATGVAAQNQRVAVAGATDDLGAMTAAFRAEWWRLLSSLELGGIVNHNVL